MHEAKKLLEMVVKLSFMSQFYIKTEYTCTRAALILIKKTEFFLQRTDKETKWEKMCLEIYQKETKLCQITYAIEL